MQSETLKNLVFQTILLKAETNALELKAAREDCPKKLFNTISSFSNQDGGGVILFGIDEDKDFEICGVYNVQDLQKKVTEQCQQMSPEARPLFTSCEIDGKFLVSAEIPGVDYARRPVFYKGKGRAGGSYIRVGDADEPMNEYEIYAYEAFRNRVYEDMRVPENGSAKLLNMEKVSACLATARRERPNLSNNVSEEMLLELLGILHDGKPTLAALMVFSPYPQALFPQLCVTAVVISGTEKGETFIDNTRFIDNRRITGSIPDMLAETLKFVQKNSRTQTVIDAYGQRADRTEYPIRAIREAVLNALIHRDYSIHTEGTPITLEMYSDRLEITNSGTLLGRISISQLGKARPETRNPVITNLLELLGLTENRYSGIPTMRKDCENAGLPTPEFSEYRGDFRVVFRNNLFLAGTRNENQIETALLAYCSAPRSRAEIVQFIGKSPYYVREKFIQPLLANGKLQMTIPEKPGSPRQRFVTAKTENE